MIVNYIFDQLNNLGNIGCESSVSDFLEEMFLSVKLGCVCSTSDFLEEMF